MLDPKNPIPRVAVASLLLGSAGCRHHSPTIASTSDKKCRTLLQCDTMFDKYYSSFADCVQSNEVATSNNFAHETAACQKATLDYYDCIYSYSLTRRDCTRADAVNHCYAEYVRYYRACY